jgi:hypothetical protein
MSFFGDIWNFVSGTGTGAEDNTLFKSVFYDDSGNIDYAKTAGILGAIGGATGVLGSGTPPPVGYQGKIPKYQATRSRVADTYDPLRRPGSGGQRYFSDMRFTPKEIIDDDGIASINPALATARTASDEQALGLAAANLANPARQAPPVAITPYTPSEAVAEATTGGSGVVDLLPAVPDYTGDTLQDVASRYIAVSDDYISPYSRNLSSGRGSYAAGGIAKLREGRYLSGSTDGMADKIPAEIDQVQPAALSDGEYVIPADVVSHLGNGNSDAGAKVLDEFLVEVREARTGNGKQGKEIDPKKLLPKVA